MKTKYHRVAIYATQGGGTAVREGNAYVFHEVPKWGDFQKGSLIPEEWGIQYCGEALTILPAEVRKQKSRNRSEKTYAERRSYFNRRRVIVRADRKKAKLAMRGTMRSVSPARIKAVMHRAEIEMKRKKEI